MVNGISANSVHGGSYVPSVSDNLTATSARRALELLSQNVNWRLSSELEDYFSNHQPKSLCQALESLAREASLRPGEFDPITAFARAATFLTLEQVGEAVRFWDKDFVDAFEEAKRLVVQAKYYFEKTERKEVSLTFSTRIESVIEALDAIIETLINAFALSDVFRHPENEMEASFRFQKMLMLASFLPAITAILVPFIGVSVSSAMITLACVVALVGLSIAYGKCFRPMATDLPYAQNWTRMAQEGKFVGTEERKMYNDKLAESLKNSNSIGAHPLLVGNKGVGKSKILKGFAHAVARGDYPELKDKKIFYFQIKDLVDAAKSASGYLKILRSISAVMGRHRESIILIFDGIHEACKAGDSAFAEPFKQFIQRGIDNFPYVIGVARRGGCHEQMSKVNTSIGTCFRKIEVERASADETEELLNSYLLKNAPGMLVDANVMGYIYQKTSELFPKSAQPYISLELLTLCLQHAAASRCPEVSGELAERRAELLIAVSKSAVEHRTYSKRVADAEYRVAEAESKLAVVRGELEKLNYLWNSHIQVKEAVYRTALKVAELQGVVDLFQSREQKAKHLLLLDRFLKPVLDQALREKAKQQRVVAVLGTQLINDVLSSNLK